MYAVQVMNFLKTLIVKTLKDRKESRDKLVPASNPSPRDHNGDQSSSRQLLHLMKANKEETLDNFEAEMKDKEESADEEEEECAESVELVDIKKSSLVNNSSGGFGQKHIGWEEQRTMSKASSIVGRVNYRVELFEAWRWKKVTVDVFDPAFGFLNLGFVGWMDAFEFWWWLLVYQEMLRFCI